MTSRFPSFIVRIHLFYKCNASFHSFAFCLFTKQAIALSNLFQESDLALAHGGSVKLQYMLIKRIQQEKKEKKVSRLMYAGTANKR